MSTTPNQGWELPTVDGSEDTWGDLLLVAWNDLDTLLGTLTAKQLKILNGATLNTSELNTLDGIEATTAELNRLNGLLATTAELNTLSGYTGDADDLNKLVGQTFGQLANKDILDEDDMATNSRFRPPSQQSVRVYVGDEIDEAATFGVDQADTSLAQADFSSGLKVRVGSGISTTDSAEAFTFTAAFDTACLSVVTNRTDAGGGLQLAVSAQTTTGFTIDRDNGIDGSKPFTYIAVGY
jgi:hypothetical protein